MYKTSQLEHVVIVLLHNVWNSFVESLTETSAALYSNVHLHLLSSSQIFRIFVGMVNLKGVVEKLLSGVSEEYDETTKHPKKRLLQLETFLPCKYPLE